MIPARARTAAISLALVAALAGCASAASQPVWTGSSMSPADAADTAAPRSPSPTPTPTGEGSWQTVSTASGAASLRIPSSWSAESTGSPEGTDDAIAWEGLVIRGATGAALAQLEVGGGGLGGACSDPLLQDGQLPARIHHAEPFEGGTLMEGQPADPHLVAATIQSQDGFTFGVGFLPEAPQPDSMPCLWYSEVPKDEAGPTVLLSATSAGDDGGRWAVESFADGEAHTDTEEFAQLLEAMRSVALQP